MTSLSCVAVLKYGGGPALAMQRYQHCLTVVCLRPFAAARMPAWHCGKLPAGSTLWLPGSGSAFGLVSLSVDSNLILFMAREPDSLIEPVPCGHCRCLGQLGLASNAGPASAL